MNNEDFTSKKKAREITKVILDFGVSQKDIENIIKNLSLELEDITIVKKFNECINNNSKDITIEKIEI